MKQKVRFEQPSPKQLIEYPLNDDGQRYWRKFRNVYKSMRFFMSPETKLILSPEEVSLPNVRSRSVKLNGEFNPQRKANEQADRDLTEALRYIKRVKELFQLVEKGENTQRICQILDGDPKKYLYEASSPLRLVNLKNQNGLTLLYIACRNGYENICKLLLNYGANPNIPILLNDIADGALAVAVRWRHNAIVGLLIDQKLNQEQYEISLKYCDPQQRERLRNSMNNRKYPSNI